MSNDRTLEWVLPRTRKCAKCAENKTPSHYSMQPGAFAEAAIAKGHGVVCNTCRISTNQNLFPEKGSTEWRWKASCAPWNNPKGPRGKELSLADVDALMFPRTTAEKFVTKPWEYMCNDCPVKQECGEYGKRSRSSGVFGGEYLPEASEELPEGMQRRGTKQVVRTPRPMRSINCRICGMDFKSAAANVVYCSRRCKEKRRSREHDGRVRSNV